MAKAQKLRVGVIGTGGIAQMMHLPHLAEREDLFEIAALADIDGEALAEVGARYGVQRLHRGAAALIDDAAVDAVMLLASGSHRETALAAMRAGKHLFIEKPLGFGMSETEELAREAGTAKGRVMVGYHKRYDPAYLRARDAVRGLRDLRHVQVTVLHPDDGAYRRHHEILPRTRRRPPDPPEIIERGVAAAVQGPFAELASDIAGVDAPLDRKIAGFIAYQSLIHDTNVVRGVIGEPEEVLSFRTWRGGLAQSSLTRFANDVVVEMTWVSVAGLRNYEETVKFAATDGRVTLVFPSPYLRHFPTPLTIERMDGDDLVVEHHTVSYDEAFRRELVAFHAFVADGVAPETTVADAMGDARWIQALLAA